MMQFVFNDGGRKTAGFNGKCGDCVTRAVAIATGKSYMEIYSGLKKESKKERPRQNKKRSSIRNGVQKRTWKRYLNKMGFEWVPTMSIGSGCKVHLRKDELPKGRLIVSVSRHLTAVIDGVIYDIFDPSRDGSRCVYGYYIVSQPNENF